MKIFIFTVLALSVYVVAAEEKKSVKKSAKRGILNEGYGLGTGELAIGSGIGLYSGYGVNNVANIAGGPISLGASHGPIANIGGHGSAASLAVEDQTAGFAYNGGAALAHAGTSGLAISGGAPLGGEIIASQELPAGPALAAATLSSASLAGASLSSASLADASLSSASLGDASLSGIPLGGASLANSAFALNGAALQSRTVHLGSSAHQTIQVNRHIHVINKLGEIVPQPYPVPVPRNIPVPVPHPVPVKVDKPYEVKVPRPYPVPEIREVPYEVIRKIPHPVPVPYNVPEAAPYPVPVPRPVPVKVHKPVPVPIPEPVPVYRRVPYLVRQVHAHVHQPPPHIHYHV